VATATATVNLVPPPSKPVISSVTNASGGAPIIAPNTWVRIQGMNLASPGDSRVWQASDYVNHQMPTQLDGVSVTVNGKNAYVSFISGTQVNVLTPPDPLPGPAQVQLTSSDLVSDAVAVQAQQYSPSFFISDGMHVAGTHTDGTPLGSGAPAKPNETVALYANGFGPTSPAVISGSTTQSGTLPTPWPVVEIGGVSAQVKSAGLVSPGVYQFDVAVPVSVQDGDNALTATYNGLSTQPGVSISIRH